MSAYVLPSFLAAGLNLALALWVFSEAAPGLVRRTFILWNLQMALWSASIAVGYGLPNAELAMQWYKATIPLAISFIAPCFLHFVMSLTRQGPSRKTALFVLIYGGSTIFAALGAGSSFFIRDIVRYHWGYYPQAGSGVILFAITFFGLTTYAFILLWQSLKQSIGARHNQLRYLLWGATLCFGSSVTNFLPLFGVDVYPIGNLINAFYSLLVAYAILEYGLMDIRVILRRGVVYGLLSGGLTAVYLSLVAVLQRVFGHYGVGENVAFYTAAFPFTVILAPMMKSRIEPLVDQTIFGGALPDTRPTPKGQDMAFMGILATEMAHELAKPLTHIMNAGSRLESSIKGASRENLRTIEKEVQRAAEILDGFAMLSPERTLHRIAIQLTELIEEAVTTLDLTEDKTITIVRRYEALPATYVNPGQIVQVLTNLTQNAWQAMPDGGELTFTLRTGEEPSGAPVVEILVTDTGVGIPAEIQEKVFGPFFTTKQAQGGRGMGLTISRAMVERHGGTIAIMSPVAESRGTRVIVRLPMNSEESNAR